MLPVLFVNCGSTWKVEVTLFSFPCMRGRLELFVFIFHLESYSCPVMLLFETQLSSGAPFRNTAVQWCSFLNHSCPVTLLFETQLSSDAPFWNTAVEWRSFLKYSCVVTFHFETQLSSDAPFWNTAVQWCSFLKHPLSSDVAFWNTTICTVGSLRFVIGWLLPFSCDN